MGYMLENAGARLSMGEASAKRALERFELGVMTEAYGRLYKELVANGRSRRRGA
jgi:hypothetical protein